MTDFEKIEKDKINVLSPFKLLVLQNFPFIEADFDSLTNYELMCKMAEYMNKINENVNTLDENETNVFNAFNAIVDYINNYFNNLDVQDEINNKLDSLVEDGTFLSILEPYIQPQLDNITNDLNILKSKVDNISTLPEGSTTGDAELIDIRVDRNGSTYSSAGNSVRGQADEIDNKIDCSYVDIHTLGWELGSIVSNGDMASSTSKIRTKWPIFVRKGSVIKTIGDCKYGVFCYSKYDSKTNQSLNTIIYSKTIAEEKNIVIIPFDCYVNIVFGTFDNSNITLDQMYEFVATHLYISLIKYESPIEEKYLFNKEEKYIIPLKNNFIKDNTITTPSEYHLSTNILIFDKNLAIKIDNSKYLFKILTFESYIPNQSYNYSDNYVIKDCTPYIESGNILYVPKNTYFIIGFMNKNYSIMSSDDINYLRENIIFLYNDNLPDFYYKEFNKDFEKDFELRIGGTYENGLSSESTKYVRTTLSKIKQNFKLSLNTDSLYYRVIYYDYNPNLYLSKPLSSNFTKGTEESICEIPDEVQDRRIRIEFVKENRDDFTEEELNSIMNNIIIKIKENEEHYYNNEPEPIPVTGSTPLTAVEYHNRWNTLVSNNLCERILLGYINNDENYPMYEYIIKHDNKWMKTDYSINNTSSELYSRHKILITSGMHGDEIQTPNNLFEFVYKMFYDNKYYEYLNRFDFYIIPLMNPTGYNARTRNNYQNININRDAVAFQTQEAQYLRTVFNQRDYDIFIDLHQAPSHGRVDNNPRQTGFVSMDFEATEEEKTTIYKNLQEVGSILEPMFSKKYNKNNVQTIFPWEGNNDLTIFRNYGRNYAKYSMTLETSPYAYYYSNSTTKDNEIANLFSNTFVIYFLSYLMNLYK